MFFPTRVYPLIYSSPTPFNFERNSQICGIHTITHLCARVTRQGSIVGSWYTREFVDMGWTEGKREGRRRKGCTCNGFDFQSMIRYCQLFSVHVSPLWICREMAVDYCIRSGTVMSICIMHRLNKRVAVLSDVVEHDDATRRRRARPRRCRPQNNYWQAANSRRRSRPVRTSKLMYAPLLFPALVAHATRHITHNMHDNDYEVVADVATMTAVLTCPSPLISGINRGRASRLKFCRVLLSGPAS